MARLAPTRPNLFADWAHRCGEAIFILDERGLLEECNDAAGRLLAADPSELRGRLFAELLVEAGGPAEGALLRGLFDPKTHEIELLLRDDRGEARRLQLRISRWRDPRGALWHGLLAEDHSERRREEEELTQLASFPELDPNPILELDRGGAITYMNAAAEALDEPGYLATILNELDRLLVRTSSDHGAHLTRELQSGETWFELGIHQIAEFQLTRIYAQEISARKRAEAAAAGAMRELERRVDERTAELALEVEIRRRAEEEAREANRAKGAFLANMSHELRTPLNAILGYTELIREEQASDDWPRVDADLGRIYGAARHLLALINDVLDLSKIEAGKMELFVAQIDPNELLAEVADTVRGLVQQRGNELICAWCALPPLRSDAQKLRQILLNLLSNAAKFTEEGRVTLAAAPRDQHISISIADTGIGIARADQERLFRPFVQAAQGRGGTGLGLAIAAEHARLLGGELTLVSAPGRGSVFTVHLPLAGPDRL
ncbi:MAG: PAS domain-containing protein [Nannocystis sp.]|nr:PAS domain-containing protein [Nannocystis sp.]